MIKSMWPVAAAIVAVTLGIGLGTFAGARRDRVPDHLTRIFSVSGASMPVFWFAIILLIVFWVYLGWFPTGRSDATIFASIAHPTGVGEIYEGTVDEGLVELRSTTIAHTTAIRRADSE